MQRYMRTRPSRSLGAGFTIVELAVVIIVLTILATVTITSIVGYQTVARDNHRASDISIIASSLEQYYRTNAVATGATYPTTATTTSQFAAIVEDKDAITAPDQAALSIVVAANTSTQTPTVNQYVYQPFTPAGTLCATAPCVRYKLYYRTEDANEVITVNSLRQQ